MKDKNVVSSLTGSAPASGFQPKSRLGRVPAAPVALPDISYEAEAIADWLKEREGPQRRPEQTARVLALVVKLHLAGQKPWPVRRQVSAHTGVSLPMLDVVMSQRQASKDITVWTATASGNIAKHESIITQRFIQPSQELINLVQGAMARRAKDNKAVKRREKRRIKFLAPPAPNSDMGCEVCEVERALQLSAKEIK